MHQIFGNEIPPAGHFQQGEWVPAKPEEFRVKCVVTMPDGSQVPDDRIRRFALHGNVSPHKDANLPMTKVCLGTTDDPERVQDLIRMGELVQQYGSRYFHSLELLDFYQGLMWVLPCGGA